MARSKNTPISGPMIQEQVRMYAKDLQLTDFKASNGWLARFKFRHNISAATLSGERASVDLLTVETWRERLPQITKRNAESAKFTIETTSILRPFWAVPWVVLTLSTRTFRRSSDAN